MIIPKRQIKPVNILIVEDNEADIRLIEEAFKEGKLYVDLNVAEDGVEAMAYLRKESNYENINSPDIILLDLNMPRKNGYEVLEEIKSDNDLRRIPVIIMTISKAEEDILKSYNLHANAYIVKPVDLSQFTETIKSLEDFWFTIVKLPPEI